MTNIQIHIEICGGGGKVLYAGAGRTSAYAEVKLYLNG